MKLIWKPGLLLALRLYPVHTNWPASVIVSGYLKWSVSFNSVFFQPSSVPSSSGWQFCRNYCICNHWVTEMLLMIYKTGCCPLTMGPPYLGAVLFQRLVWICPHPPLLSLSLLCPLETNDREEITVCWDPAVYHFPLTATQRGGCMLMCPSPLRS